MFKFWKRFKELMRNPDEEIKNKLEKDFMNKHKKYLLPIYNSQTGCKYNWEAYVYKTNCYDNVTGEWIEKWEVSISCKDYKYDPKTHNITEKEKNNE